MTETSAPITGRNSFQTRKVSKALWVAKTIGLQGFKLWRGGGGGMDRSVLWGFESCQCFVFSNIIAMFFHHVTSPVDLPTFQSLSETFFYALARKMAFYDDIYIGWGGGDFYSIICDKWWSPAELHGGKLTLTPYVY